MNVVVMVLLYTNMRLWQRVINTDGGPSNLMPSQEPNSVQLHTAATKLQSSVNPMDRSANSVQELSVYLATIYNPSSTLNSLYPNSCLVTNP